MTVDLRLDRIGAGQRRLLRHQSGRRAEREAGDVPQRLKRGRPNPPLGHQRVEALKMPLLLRRHARDQLGFGAVAAQHGELAGVDAGRAIFAGLVDAQHRSACPRAGRRGASRSSRRGLEAEKQDQRRAAERQDRVPPGHRNAEEAELHLVAADQRRMGDLLRAIRRC